MRFTLALGLLIAGLLAAASMFFEDNSSHCFGRQRSVRSLHWGRRLQDPAPQQPQPQIENNVFAREGFVSPLYNFSHTAQAGLGIDHSCLYAPNTVLVGARVVDGRENLQPTAPDCCRHCWEHPRCNAFVFCRKQGGCEADIGSPSALQLPYLGCELRFQGTMDPMINHPGLIQRKGPNVPFTSGAPLRVNATSLPGYFTLPALGSYASGISCPHSLTTGVCVLQGTVQELAQHCNEDPACQGFTHIEQYRDNLGPSLGYYKGKIDPTQLVLHQGGVLYIKNPAHLGVVDDPDNSLNYANPWINVSVPAGGVGAGALPVAPGDLNATLNASSELWWKTILYGLSLWQGAPAAVPTAAAADGGGGSNTGAIVGGVVGGVAGLALLTALAVFLARRRRRRRQALNSSAANGVRSSPASKEPLIPAPPPATAAHPPSRDAPLPPPPPSPLPPQAPLGTSSSLASPFAANSLVPAPSLSQSSPSPFAAGSALAFGPSSRLPSTDELGFKEVALVELTPQPAGADNGAGMGSPGWEGRREPQSPTGPLGANSCFRALLSRCATWPRPQPNAVPAAPAGAVAERLASLPPAALAAGPPQSSISELDAMIDAATGSGVVPGTGGGNAATAAAVAIAAAAATAPSHTTTSTTTSTIAGSPGTPLNLDRYATGDLEAVVGGMFANARNETWEDLLVPTSCITFVTRPDGHYDELGRGASGVVYRVLLNGVHQLAAKAIELGTSKMAQRAFVKEVALLRRLRHSNIVAFAGIAIERTRGYLLMECMTGGDLWAAIPAVNRRTGERVFSWYNRGARVLLDVATALLYLHDRKIVHADVKSSNVLLTKEGQAKLSDVAFARVLTKTMFTSSGSSAFGTWAWAAPELLLNQGCTDRSDVFSFGVLAYEVCTGERPQRGQMQPIKSPEEAPPEIRDLQLRCVSTAQQDRPSMQEVCTLLQEAVAAQQAQRAAQTRRARQPRGGASGGGGGDGASGSQLGGKPPTGLQRRQQTGGAVAGSSSEDLHAVSGSTSAEQSATTPGPVSSATLGTQSAAASPFGAAAAAGAPLSAASAAAADTMELGVSSQGLSLGGVG